MNLDCVLAIMEEKEHIHMYGYGYESMPFIDCIKSLRGKRLIEELEKAFNEHDDEVMFSRCHSKELIIVRKNDIDAWLKEPRFKKERTKINWKTSYLDSQIKEYLSEKGFGLEINGFHNEYAVIVNKKVVEQKNEKIKAQEDEAIELLKQII